jgi:hypothetical protein
MQLIIFGGFADGAYLVKQALEFAAAVSASAVFDIFGLLRLGIRRKCPVIRLQLTVADVNELRAVIEGSGIFFVLIGIAALVKLCFSLECDVLKSRTVGKGEGINSLDTLWDNQLFQT